MNPFTTRLAREAAEKSVLSARLAAQYLDIETSEAEVIARTVFDMAWDHGHANGEQDVENYYQDFAELANLAYRGGQGNIINKLSRRN